MWGCNNTYSKYNLAYLKHYATKSLKEFIYKKYNKNNNNNNNTNYLFDNYYFVINEHTIEKDNYINNYLNLMSLY